MARYRIHRPARPRRGSRRRTFGDANALAREAQHMVSRGRCAEARELLERARASGGGLVTDYAQEVYAQTCPLSPRGADLGGCHKRFHHRRRVR